MRNAMCKNKNNQKNNNKTRLIISSSLRDFLDEWMQHRAEIRETSLARKRRDKTTRKTVLAEESGGGGGVGNFACDCPAKEM